tara:strand:+ start:1442 stop:1669 length:228 start_codon:yes stop_codon:yes gene_type:complete
MTDLTTQQLKEELTRRGYYTGNLWRIDDVQGRFEATDDEAQDVLDDVLQGSWIIQQIFECIDDCAEFNELKEKKA